MAGIKGRETMPTTPSNRDEPQCFRVWVERAPGQDWGAKWECVALFGYLRDCLDYIASLQDGGVSCVFQSPVDSHLVTPQDRRVVYKPEPVPAGWDHV